MKKTILFLADCLDNQSEGVFRVAYNLLTELDNNSQNFRIILIKENDNNPFKNFEVISVKKFRILGFASFRLFFIIPLICILKKADLVFELTNFGPFNLPRSIKRATFIHDLTPILFPQYHTNIGAFLQKIFLKRIIKNADIIFTNSKNSKKDIIEYCGEAKDKVFFNHLGSSFHRMNSQKPKFDIDFNEYLLSVCTIEPRKNLITLISAFEIIKLKYPRIKLILTGKSGWRNSHIYERIKSSKFAKDIILTGFVSDEELKFLYENCDLFIYPSEYEGFGLPVIEAATSGATVITANNSSLREISPFPELLFETKNPEDLAEKIEKGLSNKKSIDINSIKKEYDWNIFSKFVVNKIEGKLNDVQ